MYPDRDFRRLLEDPARPDSWIMNPNFELPSNWFLQAALGYGLKNIIAGNDVRDGAEADKLMSFTRNHMQAYMALIDPNGTIPHDRYNAGRLLGVIQKFREYKANRQAKEKEMSQPWAGKFAEDLPPANYAEQLSHYKTVIDGGLVKMCEEKTEKTSLVDLAPAAQYLALRVVLARYLDEERAERNRAIQDGDQPNLWSARLDAFEVDPQALPDPFKAAFTATFGGEKVQFDPDGVAVEIWEKRVELWMGDGRKIQVPRRDLMGA